MQIRMKAGIAGSSYSFAPGDVPPAGTFSDAEAARLVAAGFAERVGGVADTPKGGIEYAGKRLFGAAAAAVLRKLGRV